MQFGLSESQQILKTNARKFFAAECPLSEVRRIMEPRLQYDFETASRTILLAIDACWSALPMMVDPRLLINKIDAFVTF